MSENRKLRGFKILKTIRGKNISLKLFAQNGNRFVVMANSYLLGISYRHQLYEFSSLEQAEFYFQKMTQLKGMSQPILL